VAQNTITANNVDGVLVLSSGNNAISQNSMFANNGGGIVVSSANTQAAPTLTSANIVNGNQVQVQGTLANVTGSVVIEFFYNSDNGSQGRMFIGSLTVTASGAFTATLNLPAGMTTGTITATATASNGAAVGNTSAFSNAQTISATPPAPPTGMLNFTTTKGGFFNLQVFVQLIDANGNPVGPQLAVPFFFGFFPITKAVRNADGTSQLTLSIFFFNLKLNFSSTGQFTSLAF
jgi:hypothetical protein